MTIRVQDDAVEPAITKRGNAPGKICGPAVPVFRGSYLGLALGDGQTTSAPGPVLLGWLRSRRPRSA